MKKALFDAIASANEGLAKKELVSVLKVTDKKEVLDELKTLGKVLDELDQFLELEAQEHGGCHGAYAYG